jgi:hypothetical protein
MKHRLDLFQYLTEKVPSGHGSLDMLSRDFLDISHQYDFLRTRTVSSLLDEIRAAGIEGA